MATEAQRETSVKFAQEIRPIENAHDAVVTSLKGLFNSVLFNVQDTRLNNRLRKEIEEIESLHYTELKLLTTIIRQHYIKAETLGHSPGSLGIA